MRQTAVRFVVVALVTLSFLALAPSVAAKKPPPPSTPTAKAVAPPTPVPSPTKQPPPPTPTSTPLKTTAPPTPTPGAGRGAGGEAQVTATQTPPPSATNRPTLPPSSTPTATSTPLPPVTGCVFDDRDGDGIQDTDEPGVSGVAVLVDGEVAGVTDAEGRFSVPAPGGRQMLSIASPEGWQWTGEPVSLDQVLGTPVTLGLIRVGETSTPVATTVSWLLVAVGLAGGFALVGLAVVSATMAIRAFERTYRRQKALELEQLQASLVEQRRAEVKKILHTGASDQEQGWRKIVRQLLADALPESGGRIGAGGLLNLSASPAPRFTVAGAGESNYLFTTSPEALRRVKMIGRRDKALPLDAGLHPAARVEVQAVWDFLALRQRPAERRESDAPTLPRQAEWFLVVRERRT